MLNSSGPARRAPKLAVECLEDRTVPTFLPRTNLPSLGPEPNGGLSIAVGDLLPDAVNAFGLVENEYVTGTGPGREGLVRVYDVSGALRQSIIPFPGFRGGINVAVGDVIGDGTPEIIAAVAGNGPPQVKVYTAGGQLVGNFFAFAPGFRGGVNVAVGNVLGGIAAGGFTGGAVSGQFKSEIIIGAASGSSPHVVVTDAAGTVLRSFFAFDTTYRGGVTVATGSIDQTRDPGFTFGTGMADVSSYDEIIVGAATTAPHVKAFSVSSAVVERLSFFAFDPSVRQGVTVAAGSTDGVRGAEIYASQINPSGQPTVHVFSGQGQFVLPFAPFPQGYSRVVNMAVGYLGLPEITGVHPGLDDDTYFAMFGGTENPIYVMQDFGVVTGDGPFEQKPRFLIGGFIPAGGSGP